MALFGDLQGLSSPKWSTMGGNTQDDQEVVIQKMFERPYSPEEFDRMPNNVRNYFAGYMGYLNAYARQQKAKTARQEGFQGISAGTYQIPDYQVSTGQVLGSRGIPKSTSRSGTETPNTYTRKDMYGNVILQPGGSGIRRDIYNRTIPESLEGLKSMAQTEYAIPNVEEEELGSLLAKRAKRVEAEGAISFPKRQEALIKSQQAQQRIEQGTARVEQGQQRIDQRAKWMEQDWNKLVQKLGHDEAMVQLKNKLSKERDLYNSDLNIKEEGLKQQFKEHMATLMGKVPDTPESAKLLKEEIDKAVAIANNAAALSENEAQRDYNRALALKLAEHGFALDKLSYTAPLKSQRERAGQEAQKFMPTGNEVVRMVNGKPAIFNADTKEFIRWQ